MFDRREDVSEGQAAETLGQCEEADQETDIADPIDDETLWRRDRVTRLGGILAACMVSVCPPAWAQSCFVEDLPAPNQAQNYEGAMRAVMIAHAPIEYRKSCGLRDDSDQRYFDAVRKRVMCTDSDAYGQFFGPYLEAGENYVFAVRRVDLRTDEDFERYCDIVERIDLKGAVSAGGDVRPDILQAQAPLFDALRELVLTRRWQQ